MNKEEVKKTVAIKPHKGSPFHPSMGDRIFDTFNAILMILLCFVTLYPMWFVICASISNSTIVLTHPGTLWYPQGVNLGAFELAFKHPLIMNGFLNILKIMAISLPINITLTLFCGYFMASKGMMFKGLITGLIMFTMFFSGGMIPSYLNVRELGLYNTHWALILPGAMSVYNSVICKTAIEAVPSSLQESAYIDGANDLKIVFRIILPLIMPTIAVLLLYYGVGHWNAWFNASIYLQENAKLPIQNIIRAVLIANDTEFNSSLENVDKINDYAESIKYAAIVITTLPILCVYPFLQKYFVKGVMIGAVKG